MAVLAIFALSVSGCSVLFAPDEHAGGPCGTISAVSDDFEGGALSPLWVQDGYQASLSQEGGRAIAESDPLPGQFEYGHLVSRFAYDLRGDALVVEVDEVSDVERTFVELRSRSPDRNTPSAGIEYEDGTLHFYIDGSPAGDLPYDPARDRRWAIRDEGGTILFQTGDGELATRGEAGALGDFDPAHVFVAFGIDGFYDQTAHAEFGGVNLDRPAGRLCTGAEFVDGFDEDDFDAVWSKSVFAGHCTYTISGGTLEITTEGPICWAESGAGVNLVDSAVELRFDEAPALQAGQAISFDLVLDDDNQVGFELDDSSFVAEFVRDGSVNRTPDLQPADAVAWRLRSDGDMLYWAVEGPDGDEVTVNQVSAAIDLRALGIRLAAEGNASAITARFGGINAP